MPPIVPTPLPWTAPDKRLVAVEPKDRMPLVAENERLGWGVHTHVQTREQGRSTVRAQSTFHGV